ncbi:DUF6265 family protein [Flavobacterium flavipallidum]|uniref:DUF6265 family protein n=1 Tax=Flavobacterium flavipallidum TaxID=3139140 RepID=A0ABU9HNF1_9FLAO
MQKIASLLFLLFIASACQKNAETEKDLIKKADWLIGNWETKNDIGTLSENWEKVNDSTYKSKSLFIKDKDTIHNESIILEQKGENLSYTTTIIGQNDNKPICFQLKESIENELIFENLKNDYPQKISYKKTSKTSLIAQISGLQSGKTTTEKYNMVKRK